jgi:hypothetical protein
MQSIVMLSVTFKPFMLSVIILNVITLNVFIFFAAPIKLVGLSQENRLSVGLCNTLAYCAHS